MLKQDIAVLLWPIVLIPTQRTPLAKDPATANMSHAYDLPPSPFPLWHLPELSAEREPQPVRNREYSLGWQKSSGATQGTTHNVIKATLCGVFRVDSIA